MMSVTEDQQRGMTESELEKQDLEDVKQVTLDQILGGDGADA